jgi:hypothetical protein
LLLQPTHHCWPKLEEKEKVKRTEKENEGKRYGRL